MINIQNFKEIATQYEVIFFDAYGVLKNYNGLIPGIAQTFEFLTEKGIDFFVLTNDASRSPELLTEKYVNLGLNAITKDKFISSGMLAREYLRYKVKQGTVAYLGTEASAHYLEALGLHTLPIGKLDLENLDSINALVLLDDEGFDWNHDINTMVNLLRKRNIPVIVANTDRSYPVSKDHVAVAIGAVGYLVEQVVRKKFIRFGKPDTQMFNFAYERITRQREISKDRILMVGDTLLTDILGGNKFGIDTVLVLTGNTLPEQAHILIESTGIVPTYVCESAVVEK